MCLWNFGTNLCEKISNRMTLAIVIWDSRDLISVMRDYAIGERQRVSIRCGYEYLHKPLRSFRFSFQKIANYCD
jgi:hypothetical protein